MIPIEPDISVYEPGQKAIVAWNGEEEILILSTDVNAGGDTHVLEIMPVPSNPKAIKKASFESFIAIQNLIWERAPMALGRSYKGKDQTEGVEVMFHEKIGAHDVSVVNASDALALTEWVEDFLEANGISQEASLQNFTPAIEDYMGRGFRFFVLDLIEISSEEKSVEPILYRFETEFLYYPLKISSPISGDTRITLFLLTNARISTSDFPFLSSYYPLRMAYYRTEHYQAPIQFNLTSGELSMIDLRTGELFEDGAWLTVLEYEGQLSLLTRDLMMTEGIAAGSDDVSDMGNIFYMLLGVSIGATCIFIGVALVLLIVLVGKAKKRKISR
ncbi:MAG: DUF2330 domain-containing protein [Candidatus Bathyarchaeia archaeon]